MISVDEAAVSSGVKWDINSVQELNLSSLGAQTVKNWPDVQETWAWSLGQEDPLEKEWLALQDSCLENHMDWKAIGYSKEVVKSFI